jgi:hypothetical protein
LDQLLKLLKKHLPVLHRLAERLRGYLSDKALHYLQRTLLEMLLGEVCSLTPRLNGSGLVRGLERHNRCLHHWQLHTRDCSASSGKRVPGRCERAAANGWEGETHGGSGAA